MAGRSWPSSAAQKWRRRRRGASSRALNNELYRQTVHALHTQLDAKLDRSWSLLWLSIPTHNKTRRERDIYLHSLLARPLLLLLLDNCLLLLLLMFNIFAFLLSPRNQSRFSFNCCWSLAGCGYQKFKALLCLQILVLCWWMVYSNRGWLDATWTGKRHSNVCGWCNGFAISHKLMLYGAQTRTKWQSVESLFPCSEAVWRWSFR